jgi:putative acetyltransferase
LQIWRAAVDATHHFRKGEDRHAIELEVAAFIPHGTFDLAVDEADIPLAFMLLDAAHMEALFVDPAYSGAGIGRVLAEHAIGCHRQLTTDVNEQNFPAIRFYERLGFDLTADPNWMDKGDPIR